MAIPIERLVAELSLDSSQFESGLRSAMAVGRRLTLSVTAPLTALGGIATRSAIQFESAFAGVRKTVDATETEFEGLRQGILDMSKTMPVVATEIANAAAAAGQLGVEAPQLLDFTRTMIMLSEAAADLQVEQASFQFARLASLASLAERDTENLASTIVEMGNTTRATEGEILELSLRIARAGPVAEITADQIVGLAASMRSLGIQSELGGTAIFRVFQRMSSAAASGGQALAQFARISGVSGEEFARVFREDAGEALRIFTEGIAAFSEQGGDAAQLLTDLGFEGSRVAGVLLALGKSSDEVARTMERAGKAFRDNSALAEEYSRRLATTESQLQILGNRLNAVAIEFGKEMAPVLLNVVRTFTDWVEELGKADVEQKRFLLGLAALTAAVPPLTVAVTTLFAVVAAHPLAALAAALISAAGAFGIYEGAVLLGTSATERFVAAARELDTDIEALERLMAKREISERRQQERIDRLGDKYGDATRRLARYAEQTEKLRERLDRLRRSQQENLELAVEKTFADRAKAFERVRLEIELMADRLGENERAAALLRGQLRPLLRQQQQLAEIVGEDHEAYKEVTEQIERYKQALRDLESQSKRTADEQRENLRRAIQDVGREADEQEPKLRDFGDELERWETQVLSDLADSTFIVANAFEDMARSIGRALADTLVYGEEFRIDWKRILAGMVEDAATLGVRGLFGAASLGLSDIIPTGTTSGPAVKFTPAVPTGGGGVSVVQTGLAVASGGDWADKWISEFGGGGFDLGGFSLKSNPIQLNLKVDSEVLASRMIKQLGNITDIELG